MDVHADLVGLKFNQGKTGPVTVGAISNFPIDDVRWDFLESDEQTARFTIRMSTIISWDCVTNLLRPNLFEDELMHTVNIRHSS